MPRFTIILLLTFLLLCKQLSVSGQTVYKILPESYLRIEGSTNLGKFYCLGTKFSDTIQRKKNNAFSALHIPVKKFGCQNILMTTEFRRTLKEKQFPFMEIVIASINEISSGGKPQPASGKFNISIAGVQKTYFIDITTAILHPDIILISGKQNMTFSEFHLTPPKFVGGSIRTNEELEVDFYLKIQSLPAR